MLFTLNKVLCATRPAPGVDRSRPAMAGLRVPPGIHRTERIASCKVDESVMLQHRHTAKA